MSRFEFDDYYDEFPNQGAFWGQALKLALNGKRGKQALADLREALLALPEPRVISRAFRTVGLDPSARHYPGDYQELLDDQGVGVCAVGAYAWHQAVKAGKDPEAAFADLPILPDWDTASWDTVEVGCRHGLAMTLATELAYRNDVTFNRMTPEERYTAFLGWIDEQLAVPA